MHLSSMRCSPSRTAPAWDLPMGCSSRMAPAWVPPAGYCPQGTDCSSMVSSSWTAAPVRMLLLYWLSMGCSFLQDISTCCGMESSMGCRGTAWLSPWSSAPVPGTSLPLPSSLTLVPAEFSFLFSHSCLSQLLQSIFTLY